MIGPDKLAEERKRQVITRAQNRHRVCISWMKTTKMGDVMITEIGPGGIAEVERDLNKALAPELARIDAMTAAQQNRIAKGLQSTMRNNLDEHGFEGMRVQIELQPARARLVKVGL
jgi:hypothetical protein